MEYRFEVQLRNQRRSTVPTFGLNLTRLLKKIVEPPSEHRTAPLPTVKHFMNEFFPSTASGISPRHAEVEPE